MKRKFEKWASAYIDYRVNYLLNKKQNALAEKQPAVVEEVPEKSAKTEPLRPLPDLIREVIGRKWDLRFNELENNLELRDKEQANAHFTLMTERSHNSVVMYVQRELPQCYRSWVDCYLYSEAVKSYHPLRHYLTTLPKWDGRDRLTELAQRVSSDALWIKVFSRWMRALVAGWLERDENAKVYPNQVAPLLLSEQQGLGKSSFCRALLPTALQRYYTDKFDLTANSGAEKHLGNYALINMDEFDRYSERQMAILKNLMQLTSVKFRRPRCRSFMLQQRTASFIGTSNQMELLTDPTGSRRFYCQPVKHMIDATNIDHDQLYAQLMAEVSAGEPLYFTKAEEHEIEQHNRPYYKTTALADVFTRFYALPNAMVSQTETVTAQPEMEWLPITQLFERLKQAAPSALRGMSIVRLSSELKRLGVPRRHMVQGNVWGVQPQKG